MLKQKIVSTCTPPDFGTTELLCLSNEILNHIFSFCDFRSLLNVRRASYRLSRVTEYNLLTHFELDCQFWNKSNVSSVTLTTQYPTLYLTHLRVPLNTCNYANALIRSHNLNLDYVQTFLNAHPDGETPIYYGFCIVNTAIASVLDDGSIIIWEKTGSKYKSMIIPKPDSTQLVYENTYSLYAVIKKDRTMLSVSSPYTQICRYQCAPSMLISKDKLGYMTGFISQLKQKIKLPYIEPKRRWKSVSAIGNMHLGVLDNGQISCFGRGFNMEVASFTKLVNENPQKPYIITSGPLAFTLVMGDKRTIIQYGYPSRNRYNMELHTFKLSEHSDISAIYSNDCSHVALMKNGKVETWNDKNYSGPLPKFPKDYKVRQIYKTNKSFAAHLEDGTIITWGDSQNGGNLPVDYQTMAFKLIIPSYCNFVAMKNDHTLVSWGDDSFNIPKFLLNKPVDLVVSNESGFLAVSKESHEVYYWGWKSDGKIIKTPQTVEVKFVFPIEHIFILQYDNGDLIPLGLTRNAVSSENDFKLNRLPMPKGRCLAILDHNSATEHRESDTKPHSFTHTFMTYLKKMVNEPR